MQNIFQLAKEEFAANQKLARELERRLMNCPEGRAEVMSFRGRSKYYHVKGGKRQYLRKNESQLIRDLLKKGYYRQLLGKTRKNQRALIRFLKEYEQGAQARVYETMNPARKRFVSPLVLPDEEFVKEWLEEHRALAEARPNTIPKGGEFVTRNGEVVRSKSEMIIADLLLELGIPYVYECPLTVNGRTIYPDFTILNVRTREVWYWEHRGRMDKEDYIDDILRKSRDYANAGIFPGYKLVFTEETANYPLRNKDVEAMARTLFL